MSHKRTICSYGLKNPFKVVYNCSQFTKYETCAIMEIFHFCIFPAFVTTCKTCIINLLKPNGISHSYQLGQFIFVLRVVGCFFFFIFIQIKLKMCKQNVETLIRRLVWVCTVCLFPIKRTLGLHALKYYIFTCFLIMLETICKLYLYNVCLYINLQIET